MVLANNGGNAPRILMGPTDSDREIQMLARSLEADGAEVQTFPSMPVEVSLNNFDMAVLVVAEAEPFAGAATDQRLQRILHAAGFLEARLSTGRVCLLVENSVHEMEAPPVHQIRYVAGRSMAAKPELVRFLSQQFPEIEQDDLHRPVSIREQAQSSELRLGMAMLIGVLLIALIPLALVVRNLVGGGDGNTTEVAGVTDTSDGADADPAAPETDVDSSSGSAGADSDGAEVASGDQEPAPAESSTTSTTEAPATTTSTTEGAASGAAAQLPATCTIDVRKSLELPEAIACDPVGKLVVSGWNGRWHNDIEQVAVTEGVTGTLYHEPRSDGTTKGSAEVDLVGTTILRTEDSVFGTNEIVVNFGAEGQHIHLHQSESRGGQQAQMTFTLDE